MSKVSKCYGESNFTEAERERLWGTDKVTEEDMVLIAQGALGDEKSRIRQGNVALRKNKFNKQQIEDYKARQETRGEKPSGEAAIKSLLIRDLGDAGENVSVEGRAQALVAQAHAKLASVAEFLKPTRMGIRARRQMNDDIFREAGGTETGNAKAKAALKGYGEAMELLRLLFNRAGGSIRRLEDWGLPQSHDPVKMAKPQKIVIREVGNVSPEEAYIRFTLPLLDRGRYLRPSGRQMNDEELKELLVANFRGRVTESATEDAKPLSNIGGKYQDHRVVHFRDGDARLKYAKAYGDDNAWRTMTDTLHRRANEVAMMEGVGPYGLRQLRQLADAEGLSDAQKANIEAIYKNMIGFERGELPSWQKNLYAGKTLLGAAQLGSAVLDAAGELGAAAVNAFFNGTGVKTFVSNLARMRGEEARRFAGEMGAQIEWALDEVGAASRYDEVLGGNFATKASTAVFNAQGMTQFNNWSRRAHYMAYAQTLADAVAIPFSKLPSRVARMFERYGINEQDWDIARGLSADSKTGEAVYNPQVREFGGANYLDLTAIKDQEVLTKLMAIGHTEKNLAILQPDIRVQTLINGGHSEAEALGMARRFLAMYQTYNVGSWVNMFGRYMMSKQIPLSSKAGYVAGVFGALYAGAVLRVQLGEVTKGRDAYDWDDSELYTRALARTAVGGQIYNLFSGQQEYYGQSDFAALSPITGAAEDVGRLVWDVGEVALTDEENVDLSRLARYAPGQSLWWGRAAFDALVIENLGRLADEEFEGRRAKARWRREGRTGQGQWIGPEGVRAPNLMTQEPE